MTDNHWYPHYLGDYIKKTSHLSLSEHGAYRLLLDHYYSTKQPLPANAEQLYRICRAFGEQEQRAVDSVLLQFFDLEGDSYRNDRADKELSKRKAISRQRSKAAKTKHIKASANAGQMQSKCSPDATTATATATEESSSAIGDFQRVYDAGSEILPQLATQNTSSIRQWLSAGCKVDLDILPEIRRLANKKPRSWGYFTNAIMDAKATREKPPPVGLPRISTKRQEIRSNVTTL